MVFYFGSDGTIQQGEAYLLVLGFFVYMAVIFYPILSAGKAQAAGGGAGAGGLLAEDHGIGFAAASTAAPPPPPEVVRMHGSLVDVSLGTSTGGTLYSDAPGIFDEPAEEPQGSAGADGGAEEAEGGGCSAVLAPLIDKLSGPIVTVCELVSELPIPES